MKLINLQENPSISYHWCGKFESPSPEWMHLTRDLTDFELFIMTEGTLYIANSLKQHVVQKGEFLLMHPGSMQYGYKQSSCSFYWLHFAIPREEYRLETACQPEDHRLVIPEKGKTPFPDRIIVLMKQLQDSDKLYHNSRLNDALTGAIFHELYSQGTFVKENAVNRQKQIYNDITDFIIYHACENIRVSEIAAYFGYNEKYLSTFFKKQAGISLKQFMLQAKMDVAKAELTDTNHTILQIAYNVGFSDAHNFTNSFKKVTGLTPSAYRNSYAKRALFHV